VIFTPDEIDKKILEVLQQEGRISMLNLADRVGLSATPCARRVREMEAKGLIRGYAARLDPESVGLSTQAVVRVRLRRPGKVTEEFEQAILGMTEVLRCAKVTGLFDYILHVIAPDTHSLGRWMREKLLCLPGVLQTDTSVVIGLVKSESALPVVERGATEHSYSTGRHRGLRR